MNRLGKIAVAAIAGTSVMTAFSYAVSRIEKENFSEPEHLGTMMDRLLPGSKEKYNVAGWAAHYAVGASFAAIYDQLWASGKIKPTVLNAILMGGVSGALAVAAWKLSFKMHPAPPFTHYNNYYAQLVPAHIIFAVFAALAYRAAENDKTKKPYPLRDLEVR